MTPFEFASIKNAVTHHFECLSRDEALSLVREAERLFELVERSTELTKDGVHVCAGDQVFHPDWNEYRPLVVEAAYTSDFRYCNVFDYVDEVLGCADDDDPALLVLGCVQNLNTSYENYFAAAVSECYSSREAMVAALKEREASP